MKKLHIVSNRLPFSIVSEQNEISLEPSVGGLATGMKSVYKDFQGRWIGWSGVAAEDFSAEQAGKIEQMLQKEGCETVPLSSYEVETFYEGFCNRTIWPLFHYFNQYVDYSSEYWESYVKVNQKFADKTLEVVDKGDYVWVHDYQLMLVPGMIKKKRPDIIIGFFLHIPFPSYEVFRFLPWRNEILEGLLGADLVGFHTYDYERHFLSSVRRLFGFEISFNRIHIEERIVLADAFPMGIDYDKFHDAALQTISKTLREKSALHQELEKIFFVSPERKLILSIDRLDYSKGIPNRLRAFERFLEKYPEYRAKATLVMLAVPSRNSVPQYQQLKREVEELVGRINGLYGSVNYSPVWYFYRSMPFENLIELYSMSDVALLTPVRDGMNLVAKEYVASRINQTGVMIISEMTGVVKEMGEAIVINPNDEEEVAEAIKQALEMPVEEQRARMSVIQKRLKRYDVFKWAEQFVASLKRIAQIQSDFISKKITPSLAEKLLRDFSGAKSRAIFLDYDGTLIHFKKATREEEPGAAPDEALHEILNALTSDERNEVVLISGRDKETLSKWFNKSNVSLISEHGVWMRERGGEWQMLTNATNSWMPMVRPVLDNFVVRTPGTYLEEKNYSLVWHYEKAEAELGELRANELKDELTTLVANHNLEIMEGNKVVEVKTGGINKGVAANRFLLNKPFDYILAMGDDWTDEYLFKELPPEAITIKVGIKYTSAAYKLETVDAVRNFLRAMSKN
ncbi:bifunctional alpha,alpha-trehalose-phosphate synthase (UDP-forming)/trehalose-phosphatase [Thermophagus sp. OGC60D27]|uniref:bifunctional alpha,alpha-trehalose-phosphate synthase (UDP-forming)/trehalose-phosphatase n=1 Tax=Thermophagus sp. OGC60D27 TaxID=3458415 RepID=UPI004037876D